MDGQSRRADLDERTRRLREEIGGKVALLQGEVAAFTEKVRSAPTPSMAEFADDARRGDLGADMKKIQDAVDRGRFTWEDVFAGRVKGAAIDSAMSIDGEVADEMREVGRRAAEIFEAGGVSGGQAVKAAVTELNEQGRK